MNNNKHKIAHKKKVKSCINWFDYSLNNIYEIGPNIEPYHIELVCE